MDNTQLHIFGSESFYDLMKEIDNQQMIHSFEKINVNYLQSVAKEDAVRIIFPEKFNLIDIKNLINLNLPNIFLLKNNQYLIKNKFKILGS